MTWQQNEERVRPETLAEAAERLRETVADWSRFEDEEPSSEEKPPKKRRREPRLIVVDGMDAVLV